MVPELPPAPEIGLSPGKCPYLSLYARSYLRLCANLFVSGFKLPPGRLYSHSAHAPTTSKITKPHALGAPSPPGFHPSSHASSSSSSSGGNPSPPYPNFRCSCVSMRSGAEPGPREDPADEDALGNPLAGFLDPPSSSSFGRFAATTVGEDVFRRLVRRFVVVVAGAGAVRESVNIIVFAESNCEVKAGALARVTRHLSRRPRVGSARFGLRERDRSIDGCVVRVRGVVPSRDGGAWTRGRCGKARGRWCVCTTGASSRTTTRRRDDYDARGGE